MVLLRIQGDFALFSRLDLKVNRCSYEVPTPSAIRGLLSSIHWKPAIRWVVDKIHVLNPIVFDNICRNELPNARSSLTAVRRAIHSQSPLSLQAEMYRRPVLSLVLKDVDYVVEAHFEFTEKAGASDNRGKHLDIFNNRVRKGRYFQHPYLGCREFPARVSLLQDKSDIPTSALADDAPRDLGVMLYDIDYFHGMQPIFYHPWLIQGVIHVAKWRRDTYVSDRTL